MQQNNILNDEQNISTDKMLDLAARLKCLSQKEYSRAKKVHTSAKAVGILGVGSFLGGVMTSLTDFKDLPQNALTIGLFGSLAGIGMSGASGRNSNFAYDKEIISNHIIDSIVDGIDFNCCVNVIQAIHLVGQHFLSKGITKDPEEQYAVETEYQRIYEYGDASSICEDALRKTFSTKAQIQIEQTKEQLLDYISQQSNSTYSDNTLSQVSCNQTFDTFSQTTTPTQEDFYCK